MNSIRKTSRSEQETRSLAAELARRLTPGSIVGRIGPLGAGKTRFVQGMAVELGIDIELVVSPTYTLCHEYHGEPQLVHIDCYRLGDDDEFLELDIDEYVERGAIIVIEWADRYRHLLPADIIEVQISETESGREIVIGDANSGEITPRH